MGIAVAAEALITAYVLILAETGKVRTVQQLLQATQGSGQARITRVATVAGQYDLVVVIEAGHPRQVGRLVLDIIQETDGVAETITLFEFDSGMDEPT